MTTNTETRAQKIFELVLQFWPVPEDVQHSPAAAVSAGREVAKLLYEAMTDECLPLHQAACVLVCAAQDKAIRLPLLVAENQEALDIKTAERIVSKEWEPIGIVALLGDTENEDKHARLFVHNRAFQVNERTTRLLSSVVTQIAADFKKGKMSTARHN
jgi:hypothetical protein